MTFLVILVALVIERFFDWSHLRHWYGYAAYQRTMMKRTPALSPYVVIALIILPLLAIVVFIEWVISGWLYGFVNLLFQLFLLIYCLGPQNLWADAFSCINALTQGDAQVASDKLKMSFGITEIHPSQSLPRYFVNALFIEANRRVFAVMFWYVALGPVGALCYRMLALLSAETVEQEKRIELSQNAYAILAVLDWLPVRLLTFLFALGGHFVDVLSYWRKKVLLGLSSNDLLLTECGTAALALDNVDQAKISDACIAEKYAVSLLDRTLVIALVMIAIGKLLV